MKLLFRNKNNNVFSSLLDLLGVKYTLRYTTKFFNEHPYKYSLYGLSAMLSEYSIKNTAIEVLDRSSAISSLDVPFVIHIDNDFAVVYSVTSEEVSYIYKEKYIKSPITHFLEIWTGILLYAEPDCQSIEPNYIEHKKEENIINAWQLVLIVSIFFILIIASIINGLFSNIGYILLAMTNILGGYFSFLLILKQIKVSNVHVDKICSLFRQKGCSSVLDSSAAKLGGIVSWSEIGLGYFFVNIIISFCFPTFILYMALINVLTLPYTIWSILYQKIVVKQFCILCLSVMTILWTIFFINVFWGIIKLSELNILNFLLISLVYIVSILSINIFMRYFKNSQDVERITQKLNSIKSNERVFNILLKEQPFYEVNKETSSILFGNIESNILITILTNPHCNPCAKMHNRVSKMIKEKNHFCFQYIFTAFTPDLRVSNKYLSAIFFNKTVADREDIYQEWFNGGKDNKELFFDKYNIDINSEAVLDELERHDDWKSKNTLQATPIILINGYILPSNYKIEDLKYIDIYL